MNGLNAFERQYRTTGALAMIAQSVADILNHHVKLAVEGIDRMYLNIYVPKLQHEQGIVWFFREHRGLPVPSAPELRCQAGRLRGATWFCSQPPLARCRAHQP